MIDPKEGLYEHAQFDGLRNNVPADRMGLNDLTVATNIDIDDSKRATRRKGHSAAVVAGAFKSLWSNGTVALAVKSETSLVLISPTFTEKTLRTGLTPGLDMSYTAPVTAVYYSNGVETGVVQDGLSRTWGLEPPAYQPAASVVGGILPAGRYQFTVTYLRADGQESGTGRAGYIDLAVAGGISLSGIPVSADAGVVDKCLYFSKNNGETLYRAGTVANSATVFSYYADGPGTVPLRTQHLFDAPAGQLVDTFGGARALVASGDTLYYSEPYALELFDLRKNFRLPHPITMVAALDNGVYVGTDNGIMWFDGTVPEKWEYVPRLAYGAIRGAAAYCSRDMVLDGNGNKDVVVFATKQGLCVGEDGGNITNLTQARFAYPTQERGAAVIRRHRGMVQGVFSLQGAETAGNLST